MWKCGSLLRNPKLRDNHSNSVIDDSEISLQTSSIIIRLCLFSIDSNIYTQIKKKFSLLTLPLALACSLSVRGFDLSRERFPGLLLDKEVRVLLKELAHSRRLPPQNDLAIVRRLRCRIHDLTRI